jgi:hypothetical protein
MSYGVPHPDQRIEAAKLELWDQPGEGTLGDYEPIMGVDELGGYATNGGCGYGQKLNDQLAEYQPVDPRILKSHNEWVAQKRRWTGTSTRKAESIEVSIPWIGVRGHPEPVPVSCNAQQIPDYGPADFEPYIRDSRRRCGNPVDTAAEMSGGDRLPFMKYGI